LITCSENDNELAFSLTVNEEIEQLSYQYEAVLSYEGIIDRKIFTLKTESFIKPEQ
jgi:hypothetical protein